MEALDIKRPQVEFEQVEVAGLSFDQIDLVFTCSVKNPNSVGVQLAGFDYDFKVDSLTLLSGQEDRPLDVPAQGAGEIRLPLSLKFKDLYALSQTFESRDSSSYALRCGFSFDLPVLGRVRVPAKHRGVVPHVKLPRLAFKDLKVKRLNLSGAELMLRLSFQNPNRFSMHLKGLDLGFTVNGKSLLKSHQSHALVVEQAGRRTVDIPISMNFLQMGSTVYEMLIGNKPLHYGLKGGAEIQTAMPMIGQVRLPIDEQGTLKLSR